MSTNKAHLIDLGVIRINPHESDRVQGDSFASWKKHAFDPASLIENLQNPARMHVIAGSEYRVTTELRAGSDAALISRNSARPQSLSCGQPIRPACSSRIGDVVNEQ